MAGPALAPAPQNEALVLLGKLLQAEGRTIVTVSGGQNFRPLRNRCGMCLCDGRPRATARSSHISSEA